MDFNLTEEQRIIQDTAKKFAEKEILPFIEEDEKEEKFRPEIVKKMGEMGFLGCCIPEKYGGTETGFFESVLIAEQLARVSASWRIPLNMQNIGPAITVNNFGTEEQKEKYIPGWVSGESIGFFAITEPNAGSDVAGMGTTATDKGDHWEINGQKMWISNATYGDWGLLFAYTDKSQRYKGMTCFIINLKETPGVTTQKIDKLGLLCSPTGEIVFDGAKIPKDSVLGNVGDGFKICMWTLNNTRLNCASGALGLGSAAIEDTIKYVNEREQFGEKIGKHQMIQAQIAEMSAHHESARMLVYRAAWLKDNNYPNQYETSLAKLVASESAVHAANEAMKIFGSYGYSKEYPIERYYRDCKSFEIVEGTTNIQKIITSRILLGEIKNR